MMSRDSVEFRDIIYLAERGQGELFAAFSEEVRNIRTGGCKELRYTAVPIRDIPFILRPQNTRESALSQYFCRTRGISNQALEDAMELGRKHAFAIACGQPDPVTGTKVTLMQNMGSIQKALAARGQTANFRALMVTRG